MEKTHAYSGHEGVSGEITGFFCNPRGELNREIRSISAPSCRPPSESSGTDLRAGKILGEHRPAVVLKEVLKERSEGRGV